MSDAEVKACASCTRLRELLRYNGINTRELIQPPERERTKNGRPSISNHEEVKALRDQGMNYKEICLKLNISRSTAIRRLNDGSGEPES